MERLKFQLQSECPLICHNGQLADPMNSFSKQLKQISGKRGKTDADLEQMAKIEWYASFYIDNNNRLCIPSDVMEAALINGSKKHKLGNQAKAGLFVVDNIILEFDGSKMTIDELWERDENRFTKAVRVGNSRVMRTRFWAKDWQGKVEIAFDPGLLNPQQIRDIMKVTGEVVGICDWRPRFGRFAVEAV